MHYRTRKAGPVQRRIRPWMWLSLTGALIGCPLLVWAVLSTLGDEDAKSSPVGKTVSLRRTPVAVTKAALEKLILTQGRAGIPILVSTGQVLIPPAGTYVKVTYTETFQNTTIYQVLVENGKYKGRTVWITQAQMDWRGPGELKKASLPDDNSYELPPGMDSGDLDPGLDIGIPDGGIGPDN